MNRPSREKPSSLARTVTLVLGLEVASAASLPSIPPLKAISCFPITSFPYVAQEGDRGPLSPPNSQRQEARSFSLRPGAKNQCPSSGQTCLPSSQTHSSEIYVLCSLNPPFSVLKDPDPWAPPDAWALSLLSPFSGLPAPILPPAPETQASSPQPP